MSTMSTIPVTLQPLHDALMHPILRGQRSRPHPEIIQIGRAAPGSGLAQTAAQIVAYSYAARYAADPASALEALLQEDGLPYTEVLVAWYQSGATRLVLGTLRLGWGPALDVLQMFTPQAGHAWPHQRRAPTPPLAGELGRFALHPLFDAPALSLSERDSRLGQKYWLFNRLCNAGLVRAQAHGVDVLYYIMSPYVYAFAAQAGLRALHRVTGLRPGCSAAAETVRQTFASYWKPTHPMVEQPAVYVSPWQLDPVPWGDDAPHPALQAEGSDHAY